MASVTVRRYQLDLRPSVLPTAEDMKAIGLLAIQRIWTRTKQGRDVDGRPFAPYADGYEKQRTDAGRPSRPDLQVSGEMLRAMTVTDITPQSVTIGFTW
jgi:hypothetical protein